MKKAGKILLILLLMLTLLIGVTACNRGGNNTDEPVGGGNHQIDDPTPVNPVETFDTMSRGLLNMGQRADRVKNVTSSFTLRVKTVNVTVNYEANYNKDREQDGEYLLRIFDNNFERTVTFLYYTKGSLYYQLNGVKREIHDFGGQSIFPTFVETMQTFDVGSLLAGETFRTNFAKMGYLADARNMTRYRINEFTNSITASAINLDDFKPTVNQAIRDGFGLIGTKLDTLGKLFLGFGLSDLSEVEIGQLTVDRLQVISSNTAVTDFRIKFYGMQSNNIEDYLLDMNYAVKQDYGNIKPGKYEDPAIPANVYERKPEGNYHFGGTIYIPMLDTAFTFGLRAVVDVLNNDRNQVILEIVNKQGAALSPDDPHYINDEIFMAYYIDEILYVDVDGLMQNYIRNGVKLEEMNFPKVRFEGLNLSQEINSLMSYLLDFMKNDFDSSIFENILNDDSRLRALLSKVESNGSQIKITLDAEFVREALGGNATGVAEWIAARFGISVNTVNAVFGSSGIGDTVAEITYDMDTGVFDVSVFNGETLLFRIDMTSQEMDENGVDMTLPQSFDYTKFREFNPPQSINMHLEGSLTLQNSDAVDFSRLMGVFIGDVTGVNTPMMFTINDELKIDINVWQQDDRINVQGTMDNNGVRILELYASQANPDYYLVNNLLLGVKYRIPRTGLNEALDDLLGENHIYKDNGIVDIFRILVGNGNVVLNDDSLDFSLATYRNEKGEEVDPIYELVGIHNLIGRMKAQFFFKNPDITVLERDYLDPEIENLPDRVYESMYEATWHDVVNVTFRDNANQTVAMPFKLSFIGESAVLVSGRYFYTPEAKLFGRGVSYHMTLTDNVNGTKVVEKPVTYETYVDENGEERTRIVDLNRLSLDPSAVNPFPERLLVEYDDGTIGRLAYQIEGFPYTFDNIGDRLMGLKPAKYKLYIGKGSIAETVFEIDVEILNRVVQVADDAYYGDVPIVSTVFIDPYDYSIQKQRNPDYSPIPADLRLTFGSNLDEDSITYYTARDFQWDYLGSGFTLDSISYRGGNYFVFGYFNRLKLAMNVVVSGKIASHIQITGEKIGEYTVDSLVRSTYTVPTMSTADVQIRIYFETGHYRIVGEEPENYVQTDGNCDGFYPYPLRWTYPLANVNTVDRVLNPLDNGQTRTDTAPFGDSVVGTQEMRLTVVCPSRRVREMANSELVITEFLLDENGDVIEEGTKISAKKISAVGFGETDGTAFEFDPYEKDLEKRHLPSVIYMNVEVAGNTVRKAYPVTWQASTVIDGNGVILHPRSEDCLLLAVGTIGDVIPQNVYMLIHNRSGEFESVEMRDPVTGRNITPDAEGKYYLEVNQYENFRLPATFTLTFSDASAIPPQTYATDWVYEDASGTHRLADGYRFPYMGGTFEVVTYVAADNEQGILAQEVRLQLTMKARRILTDRVTGLWSDMDNERMETVAASDGSSLRFVTVDGYSEESGIFLAALKQGIGNVGVFFPDLGENTDDIPVTFENVNELIAALQSPKGTSDESLYPMGFVTLRGKVHKGNALEQDLNLNFKVVSRVLKNISFVNLDEEFVESETVAINTQIGGNGNNMTIELKKPYRLEGRYTQENGIDAFGLVTPSQYLNYLFGLAKLAFEGDAGGDYAIPLVLPEDFDRRAFNPDLNVGDIVVLNFQLNRLSYGSTADTLNVEVRITQDAMTTSTTTVNVETFYENGTPRYSNGYEVQNSAEVTYMRSGKVIYAGLTWFASGNYTSVDGKERITDGDEVSIISNTFFNTMRGNSINLKTTLSNGKTYNLILRFYKKDIGRVNYNATAADSNYSITAGTITIDNVYNVYPFAPDKIPAIITPFSNGTDYVQGEGGRISFTVQWVPSEDFANGNGEFDPVKINELINSKGYVRSLLATAHVPGHTGEAGQTVELYIQVRTLNDMAITHQTLDIVGNHLTLDPYRDNYGGDFILPKDIAVNFVDAAIGNIDYRFTLDDNVSYEIQNGEVWESITHIPYSHLGHMLGARYGNPTDTLTLRVTLPDGKQGTMEVSFISRELVKVLMQNLVTKQNAEGTVTGLIDKKYFIDPYHDATFTVPKQVVLQFKAGADIAMDIDWAIGSAPFELTADGFRLLPDETTYAGGRYRFGGNLSGYGVAEQPFAIDVVILNRSLSPRYIVVPKTYTFTNPVFGLVSDLNESLMKPIFVALSEEIYDEYNAVAEPVVPAVVWDMLDDDIGYDGFEDVKVTGTLTYGAVGGETTDVTVSAPKVEFISLQGVDDNIIDFNPYTLESVNLSFVVNMRVSGKEEVQQWVFYSETAASGDAQKRMMIHWGEHDSATDNLKTFTLGNAFKSIVIPVERKYRYNYQQIMLERISFGFDENGAASGQVNAVVDPLNPAVPTSASAWGRITGSNEEIGPMTVNVRWDESIFDMPLFGGDKLVTVYLSAVETSDSESIFTVRVHYLDRTPTAFYTPDRGFSSQGSTAGYFPLALKSSNNMGFNWYFELDPVSEILYNPEDGTYKMPTRVRITFRKDYDELYMLNAVDRYGADFIFTDIEWALSRPVELYGTPDDDPIKASMLKFRLRYTRGEDVITSDLYDYTENNLPREFELNMKVTDREVEYTNVSHRIVPQDGSLPYQKADSEYFIDPYDIRFPEVVEVYFKSMDLPQRIENIVWEYDNEFLEKPEVISGLIAERNPDALNLRGTIKVFGAQLHIMFAIKPRNINISTGIGDATRPLSGGKLFVLQGIPLRDQLPTSLYYKFTYEGNLDVAAVPLNWPSTVFTTISTARAGLKYTNVVADLGLVDKGNVVFDIEVIDPVLYNVIEEQTEYGMQSFRNGSAKYNYIVVAKDRNDYYIEGREGVVLPKRVLVNEDNEYLEIERVEYDILGGLATFRCKYTFLTASNSPDLSGNANGLDADSAKLPIQFTLPLRSYDFTEAQLEYNFRVREHHVQLGAIIDTESMPRVYDEDGKELELIWDMRNVDTRLAGTYTADGYYRDAYSQNILKTLTVIVDPREIDVETKQEVVLAYEWLNRPYSGVEVPIERYLTIADFLRKDGTYGQVENYVVEYSLDGGFNWQSEQPVQVQLQDRPAYRVRITISDYNIYGSVEFELNISKQLIRMDEVKIVKSESDLYASIEYEYDGEEHFPFVAGLPAGATYIMVFNQDGNIRPLNAGRYDVRVTFPDQRNFQAEMEVVTGSMVITKKDVTYQVRTTLIYNGMERDAEIIGLPEDLGDIRVEYRYFLNGRELPAGSKVRDAGHYRVTVSVHGGMNYPDALNTDTERYENLRDREFTIEPKRVIVKVNRVESEYLSALKPMNSAVSFVDAEDGVSAGLMGTDSINLFESIQVAWVGGTLTYKHMVGEYPLRVTERVSHPNYDVVGYEDGVYAITATAANVRVIENKADLDARIALLQDGDTVRWYLRAGDYGDIVLNKNASVSIVGSYNLTADKEEIAVHFNSVTIERGAVLLDIVSLQATADKALVFIGANADSVTVNRSEFVPRGNTVLRNSVAIRADSGYQNTLYMEGTIVSKFTRAVDMKGGSVNLRSCTFNENTSVVFVENGNVTLNENEFLYTRGDAVYIAGISLNNPEISIVDNRFVGNVAAIRTYHALYAEVTMQNVFDKNASDIVKLD